VSKFSADFWLFVSGELSTSQPDKTTSKINESWQAMQRKSTEKSCLDLRGGFDINACSEGSEGGRPSVKSLSNLKAIPF
jgi:hypothetical protein